MSYNLGDSVGYIKLNIQNFEENYRQVLNDARQLDAASSVMGKGFSAASKVMAAAFATVSAAATAALKSVVQAGSSFQAAMSQVAATMGMTADEVANNSEAYRQLSASAKEMGATTKFSATQAAEALNYLALASYSVEESISSLPKILDVAAAGGMDLAKASDMVTDAMSALGIPLEEMDAFIDKLARTAQRSNTSVSQLGEAILQIGGTAKSLTGGVTELDTALGILANNGIKAAEGGTALRQVILNLTAPTQQAAEYMDSIGLSAYDAAGNMKSLNQIFSELNDILSQFDTQQQRDNVITSIFDARQLKSARALLSGYGDSWNELYDEIENSNGAAHRMAETMQENLTGAITIAKSAIEGVQVTAFEALEKGLTKSVKTATRAIDELNKTLQTPEMQEALNKIGTMLGDVLVKFTQLVANEAIPRAIQWFSQLREVADNLKSVLVGLTAALPFFVVAVATTNNSISLFIAKMVAAKMATLAANAALLANPYTAVAAALVVLTTAVVSHVKEQHRLHVELVNQKTAFSEAADSAREGANALQEYKNAAGAITNEVTEQINEVRVLYNELGEYANKINLTSEELATAQTFIEKLNELFPENTAYIEDGQIKGYEGLAEAIGKYTDKLYYAKKLEAEQEIYFGAKDTIEQSKKDLEEYEKLFIEANEEFKKWQEKWDKYKISQYNYQIADQKEAYRLGFDSVRDYLNAQYIAASKSLENINLAITTTRKTIQNSQEAIKESEKNMLDYRLKSGEEVEGVYLSQAEAEIATNKMKAAEIEAINKEIHKDEIEQLEKEARDKEEAYNKMWDDIAKLDKQWQLRQIGSEEEYQNRRKELLELNRNEDDENWVKEYNKSLVYIERETERAESEKTQILEEEARKREQIRQEELDAEFRNLERKLELDEDYSKQAMIKDAENLIANLDKNSDLYKQFNNKILDYKHELAVNLKNQNKQIALNEFETWKKSYDDLEKEAEKAYDDLIEGQNNLTNTIVNSVKLYDTETTKVWNKQKRQYEEQEKFIVNSKGLKTQIQDAEKYLKTLEGLTERGLSNKVFDELSKMSEEEQKQYVEQLAKMSDKELKEYSADYDELYALTKKYTDEIYKERLKSFEEEYAGKFDEIFKNVPKSMNLVGEESIQGFLDGIETKKEQTTGVMQSIMNDVLSTAKEVLDIHSPSGKFEEIGLNSIQGFIQGIVSKFDVVYDGFKTLGETSGNNFVNGFKSVWEQFRQTMQNDLALQNINSYSTNAASSFNKPMINGWQNQSGDYGGLSSVISQLANSRVQQDKNLTKADIIDAIKQASPDGNIVLQIDGRSLATITRRQLNNLAQESGNLNLKG